MTQENNIAFYKYNLTMGEITIACDAVGITLISNWDEPNLQGENKKTPLLDEAAKQLEEYFKGKRQEFDLPLNPQGTVFQRQVWQALCQIPYGETRSYKDIAEMIGNPKACRAVGGANNKNPIMIVIPCHRVIGANGKLVGYGGGLNIKEYLLNIESR